MPWLLNGVMSWQRGESKAGGGEILANRNVWGLKMA